MKFTSLGLSQPILNAVLEQGYETPTPIQEKAIPLVLNGHDVMAAAQTGTGKTAGFTLPMLEILSQGEKSEDHHIRALVLTPTRELAAQVADSVKTYGSNLDLTSTVVYGGVKINPQKNRLRRGTDICIATPGRLLDLYNQKAVKFQHVEMLILDEADRMLDMGFLPDIKRIIKMCPKDRQSLMFSATFSKNIRELAHTLLNDPKEVSVSPKNTAAETVKQIVHPVDKKDKPQLLLRLIEEHDWDKAIIFMNTKYGTERLAKLLNENDVKADAIHGDKKQGARTRILNKFKKGALTVLVATDVAARGLDIDALPHVINYDLPTQAEDYVHRIGRTGRAGTEGEAISLVSADEARRLFDIERLINQIIPREELEGFEPKHNIPESLLGKKKSGRRRSEGGKKQASGRKRKPKSEHRDGPKRRKGRGDDERGSIRRRDNDDKPRRARRGDDDKPRRSRDSDKTSRSRRRDDDKPRRSRDSDKPSRSRRRDDDKPRRSLDSDKPRRSSSPKKKTRSSGRSDRGSTPSRPPKKRASTAKRKSPARKKRY